MGVDKIDSVGLPVEERSGFSRRDVFDLRNLRSSLPTTNPQSEYRQRIMKAKVALAILIAKTKKLEEFTAPHRSAILGITTPYPKEEENMVSALKRLALSDKPENRQELNITSLRIMKCDKCLGNVINSKLRFEQAREERLKARKESRLRRVCLSRGLSMENIESETKESLMKELSEKLKRYREEYEESVKLIRARRDNAV